MGHDREKRPSSAKSITKNNVKKKENDGYWQGSTCTQKVAVKLAESIRCMRYGDTECDGVLCDDMERCRQSNGR